MKKKIVLVLLFSIAAMILPHAATAQSPAQVTPPAASTSKISFDIKGMDIVDVLKMLSARSGMNIVVGKNVTGRVTLFLKEVEIWDAFEIILAANDLAYEKKDNIINVMTQRDYELLYGQRFRDKTEVKVIPLRYAKAADVARTLTQLKSNVGRIVADEASNAIVLIDTPEKIRAMEALLKNTDTPLQTRVFSLNYAPVDKLSTKLQEAITKGIGSLKMDERTNKIAVSDYPYKLDEIGKLIEAFDEKTPQVLIDAQILQVSPSDQFEMGVDWDYWMRKYFEVKAALPVGTANRLFVGTTSTAPGEVGDYKAVLDILRTIGDVKVLSSPRVMALNNQEAKIHVGTRDAYITSTTSQAGTGTAVTSQSVNFVDTGIQLYVTPTINRDGFVTMKIKPEISDSTRTNITAEGQVTQVPIVTTSEAETTVMVKDGVTVIIGGLRKDKREKTVKKIPLLGDIPLAGFFFRSTSDAVTQSDLVILLTPHIMSGEKSFTEFTQVPPKEGTVIKLVDGKIVKEQFVSAAAANGAPDSGTAAKYRQYYQQIAQKISALAAFDGHPETEKGVVKIAFTLSRDGVLLGEPVVFESTNPLLNAFAVNVIKGAVPFPAFQQYSDAPHETFKMSVSYQ